MISVTGRLDSFLSGDLAWFRPQVPISGKVSALCDKICAPAKQWIFVMSETVRGFLRRMFRFDTAEHINYPWRKRPALDARLHAALLEKHKTNRKVPKSFNAIAVKFAKIDKALRQIRKVFAEVDTDHSNSISVEEMKVCFQKLKVNASSSEIEEVYRESDMDHNGDLTFKEFIITLVIIHLTQLPQIKGESRLGLPDVDTAFELIYDAFFFFDRDMDGVLSRPEVRASFGDSLNSEHEGSGLESMSLRFDEMDFDSDGQCTFKEFLFAFIGWVGTAEDEDEEDEDD